MKASTSFCTVVGLALIASASTAVARESAAQRYAQQRSGTILSKAVVVKSSALSSVAAVSVAADTVAYDVKVGSLVAKRANDTANSDLPFSEALMVRRTSTATYTTPPVTGAPGQGPFDRSNPPGPNDRPSVFSGWVWTGSGWVWGADLPCHSGGSGGISPC